MVRPICSDSLKLERSMNNHCRLMKIEDLQLYRKAIDTKDDERREERFKADKWLKDRQKGFSRERKRLLELEDLTEMREGLIKLDEKVDKFNAEYFDKVEKLQELELYYEALDDNASAESIEYVTECQELNKEENFRIDLRVIEENREKKKAKN